MELFSIASRKLAAEILFPAPAFCTYVSLGVRSVPRTTARPVIPSRPIIPTSTCWSGAPSATTDTKPLSGKYMCSTDRWGVSRRFRSGRSTGLRCGVSRLRSLSVSAERILLTNGGLWAFLSPQWARARSVSHPPEPSGAFTATEPAFSEQQLKQGAESTARLCRSIWSGAAALELCSNGSEVGPQLTGHTPFSCTMMKLMNYVF